VGGTIETEGSGIVVWGRGMREHSRMGLDLALLPSSPPKLASKVEHIQKRFICSRLCGVELQRISVGIAYLEAITPSLQE
jgi:hypothetical protein